MHTKVTVVTFTLNLFGVLAECNLLDLCIEIKIFVIVCGSVALIAIVGVIVLGIKLSRAAHQKRNSAQISRETTIPLKGIALYDEIEDKSSPEECRQKQQEARPPQYEEAVIKDTTERYDSFIHRPLSLKRISRKGLINRKSHRLIKLEASVISTLENLYSIRSDIGNTIKTTKCHQTEEKPKYMAMNAPAMKRKKRNKNQHLQPPYVPITTPEIYMSTDILNKAQ